MGEGKLRVQALKSCRGMSAGVRMQLPGDLLLLGGRCSSAALQMYDLDPASTARGELSMSRDVGGGSSEWDVTAEGGNSVSTIANRQQNKRSVEMSRQAPCLHPQSLFASSRGRRLFIASLTAIMAQDSCFGSALLASNLSQTCSAAPPLYLVIIICLLEAMQVT